jgi:hypothetical protein
MLDEEYLEDTRLQLRKYKELAEKALAQIGDADLFAAPGPETNSIAIVIKHMAGNMRSRWTDFLASDGEKAWRDRDGEFALRDDDPSALLREWEEGWRITFAAVDGLVGSDLTRTVTIRGEPHSVARALVRQVDHYGQHVGQILLLAKHLRGPAWRTLSLPTPPRGR